VATLGEVSALLVQRYLTRLRERLAPASVHQHYRCLRTFLAWCVHTGLLTITPMTGITVRVPKSLPRVPEDDHVRRLLAACSNTFEGQRNKALVALLADSGLRISEALRLRIEDVSFPTRTFTVRGGKGGKDSTAFFGAETAQHLRRWLQARRDAMLEDYLFSNQEGRPLSRFRGTQIVHRLSVRAGLSRRIGPHALRHYAATSILKPSGGQTAPGRQGIEPRGFAEPRQRRARM
jgi:site-specific recombinase XerD